MSNADISRMAPPIRPQTIAVPNNDMATRHATTLAEIQQMTSDYRRMQLQLAGYERDLDAKQNKIELLENSLAESHHAERVYRNKLIRLSAAMDQMHILSAEAHKIMIDSREMDEAETERAAAGTNEA